MCSLGDMIWMIKHLSCWYISRVYRDIRTIYLHSNYPEFQYYSDTMSLYVVLYVLASSHIVCRLFEGKNGIFNVVIITV